MTAIRAKEKRGVSLSSVNFGWVAFGIMSIFCLLLILKNSDIAIKYMSRALTLCTRTVIPSLFPFMVISELIVSSGAGRLISRFVEPLSRRLFGISADSSAALILGMLCGFPIGARCARSLYRGGRIDRDEYSRLMSFCNTPSSAFLISAVGVSMFGNRSFGILLYAASLLSAAAVGIAVNLIYKNKKNPRGTFYNNTENTFAPSAPKKGISAFTDAVSSSALSMLNVCAFVVFFSTLVGTLEYSVSALGIPDILAALGYGFFEMTSGISKASTLPAGGALVAAFISGWSGLSVHFQIMSICGTDISYRPYLLSKFFQGLLNVLTVALCAVIFCVDITVI